MTADIAIIGLGCRFPGAPDVLGYWNLLLGGARQFAAVPGERWNHETFHAPGERSAPHASHAPHAPHTAHTAYTDQVAFLDSVDRFDALHHGVPRARARAMDPQHRLLLDVSREALDDAGMGRGDFDRENTGVFFADPADLPGSLLDTASGTVSRQFDLGGPALAVGSACSGSLVALDQAMAHLRQGTCRIALVGGVHLNLTPDSLVGFSRLRALSAAGVCRPFDAEADGFVLGEGAGVVVIRPLADALAAGDRVYAVIKGIGSANDGASPGPLQPASDSRLRAMRRAYEDAGVAPSSVGFVEAHGTGTAAEDRAEAEALRRLRTEYPDDDPALCYLASGKALIGHSLAAAGIAGLIKTALVVHHRTIVPQPATTPHPDLGISAAGLRFADTPRPFPGGGTPRRAAVSSFGFGGTDVHVVLEERPDPVPRRPAHRAAATESARADHGTEVTRSQLVFLSAGNPELLDQHIGEVLDVLDAADRTPLAAVAHTLGARAPLPARLAIVATDTAGFLRRLRHAREQLLAGARGDLGDGAFAADAPLPTARRRTAFLYPGQGSQRPGMMRDLYERFPAYRSAVCVLSAVARADLGFDLADLLYGEASAPQAPQVSRASQTPQASRPSPVDNGELGRMLAATEVCQPLLGTVQIAATRVLADCGITPDLALGHSTGEFAAAAAAGALTHVDAVRLLVHRGAALRRAGSGLRGGMLAVQTDKETCRRLVDGIDDVWLACFNQPRQVVVSGTPEGLAALREACAEAGIVTAALDVANAFHTPRLARAEEAVRSGLAARRISSPAVAFVSSVNAEVCTDPGRLRELWTRHASAPVLFDDAVRTAYDQGARVFLQVAGGTSLLTSVRRNLTGHGDVHVIPVTGEVPDDGRTFVLALARLAVLGAPVDPRALVPAQERRLLDLPVAKLEVQSYRVTTRRPANGPAPAPPAVPGPAALRLAAPLAVPAAPAPAPRAAAAPAPAKGKAAPRSGQDADVDAARAA
ncbi:type I polyketide synthase [Streptomyces sp. NBC_01244]|uniref:type I polyketide synthase n=1 Tax=Streptomyces sp. NBC_01244 TaxID=2903797 RepID=UPI002E149BFB|nr:type I polyketide synthase [Streptomyces sp. NBC_01244]